MAETDETTTEETETNETANAEETEPEEPAEEQEPAVHAKKKTRFTKKEKKLVRRRTAKKEVGNLASVLRLAVETGKVEFGTNRALREARLGKPKVLVVAANAPAITRDSVRRYCGLSQIPLIEFEGSSLELGSVCGKPFPVAVLSVQNEGSSNILEFAKTDKPAGKN